MRPIKVASIVASLALLQAGLYLGFRHAAGSPDDGRKLVVEAVAELATPRPPAFTVETRTDKRVLGGGARPTLVHFWATWCKPCREELPELLALAEDDDELGVDFAAVSVDESWDVIDYYFDGRTPGGVVRASHDDARAAFGFETLPVTFLVDASGRVRFRLPGAQPWATSAAREWVVSTASSLR